MKNFFLILMLLVSATSFAGGISGGGGGPVGQSVEETKQAVVAFNPVFTQKILKGIALRLNGGSFREIEDVRAEKIYKAILSLSEVREMVTGPSLRSSMGLNDTNKFIKFVSSPQCEDPFGKGTASSYIKGTRSPIQICMNIPLLSQLSSSELHKELSGILVHELAHAAGYEGKVGEQEARYVQIYHMGSNDKDCVLRVEKNWNSPPDDFSLFISPSIFFSPDGSASMEGLAVKAKQTSIESTYVEDFYGKISRNENSEIHFKYMDFEGVKRQGNIKLKAAHDWDGVVEYYILDSDVTIKGQKVQLGVARAFGCFLSRSKAEEFLKRD